jgi:asparagine synthase (glutamine-hydrolysing)
MSDFFLSIGVAADEALVAGGMRFTKATSVQIDLSGDVAWAVSRVDDLGLWGHAWDEVSQTRVLIGGRIALEELNWAAAERLPYRGGLAARHIISHWLSEGARGVQQFNGAALIIVLDQRTREAHIFTDRFGFFPAFASEGDGVILASHPDLIARVRASTGKPLSVDAATIAEFLHTGSPFPKHTLWQGVSHLDAASHYVLSPKGGPGALAKLEQYWTPAFMDGAPPMARGEFVEAFADAFRAAGRRRSLRRLGRTALLLSAGADSRGVLAATASPSDVDCYTYYDEPNDELRGAKRIAALAGARHFPLRRSADYYVANAEETVRLSGGMWGFDAGHHTGFVDAIRETSAAGTLLTGEFCDLLFKGVALNRRHIKMLGRDLPLHEVSAHEHEHYLPFEPIAPEWISRVNERLEDGVPLAIQCDSDPRKAELARLSPLSRYGAASSIQTLWRMAPFDVFVADNDILDAYGLLSVPDKVSGIAFGQAIARVTGPKMAAVPNNNYGAPVGGTELSRVATFLGSSAMRKLKHVSRLTHTADPRSVATSGSWPSMSRVALNSEVMRQWYQEIPERAGCLLDYLDPSRRSWTFDEYATQGTFQLYRLLTVLLWLDKRP